MTLLEDRVKRKYKMMRQQRRSADLAKQHQHKPTTTLGELRRKFDQINTDKT